MFFSKLISNDFNFIVHPFVIGIFYMFECSILIFFADVGFETLTLIPFILTLIYSVSFWFNLLLFVYGLSLGDPIKVMSIIYVGIVFTLIYNVFIFKQGFDSLDLIGSFSIVAINIFKTVIYKN